MKSRNADTDVSRKGNSSKGRKGYSNRRNNGRKPKGNYVPPEERKDLSKEPGDVNNPAYYYEDANVLSQVMNFSFNQFGGVPIDVMLGLNARIDYMNWNVMALGINPSVPVTSGNTYVMNGATTAALRNFLMLSGSNAKTTSYAPQDVILLELALSEVIKMSTFCARAFGIAYMFNYRNRTYPDVLLQAMGINAADFRNNLAVYRIRFNTLMALASKIPFPNSVAAFSKAADIFGSLYLDDEDSSMAQTYLFVPATTWVFDEQYDTNGSGLRTTDVVQSGTIKLFDIYLSILEQMINALLNSTSLNYIYSDIMRLVQNGKVTSLITFTSIPEDFNIVPVYNKEIETWIHNAVILGAPLATADQYNPSSRHYTTQNDVSSDANNNTVFYWPQFETKIENSGYELFIDFDHDNVSVEDRVRATRLSQRYMVIKDSYSNATYTDEIALNDNYLVYMSLFDGINTETYVNSIYKYDPNDASLCSKQLKLTDRISKFDWHPIFYLHDDMQEMYTIGDLDYYTLLDYHTIKNMYDYEIINFLQIK